MKNDHDGQERALAIRTRHAAEWPERLARLLIRQAARAAPSTLSERLEEEWLADLIDRPSALSRLRFGLGCCWASRVIAADWIGVAEASPAAVAGSSLLTPRSAPTPSLRSRRGGVLVVLVGLHIVLIYALSHGLGSVRSPVVPPPPDMDARIDTIERHPVDPPPLPTPPIALTPRTLMDPTTDIPLDPIVAPEDNLSAAPAPAPAAPSTSAVRSSTAPVDRVRGGPGRGFPHAEDFYPPGAIRLGEAGTVIVQVCVDATGHLTAEPAVVESSGAARLDAAALKLAQAGSGRYRPTLENGQPVASCYPFRVTFSLRH